MSIKISEVLGNSQKLDGGAMFGNVPRALWQNWSPPDEKGRIDLACRALLLEIGKLKVLCETGIGAFMEPKLADRFGVQDHDKHLLLENLKALDVSPQDIDFVILSHLHFDHAGGMLNTFNDAQKDGKKIEFSKAKYLVGNSAYKRAKEPHFRDKASFIPELQGLLEESERLILLEDDSSNTIFTPPSLPSELKPYVSFVRSEGHTPGQMHALIKGNSSKLFFAGDLIPGLPWIHLPVTMGYDRYPEKLIDEKMNLYNSVLEENWWIFFTHDTQTSACKLERNEKGKYCPKELQDNPKRMEI